MIEEQIVKKLIENKETISSMESCTAGFFATTITNVEGSSEVLKFSAITYSNEFKIKMGINEKTIEKYSVYSFETAQEMAKCINDFTKSTYSVGITGQINRLDPENKGANLNEIFVSIYNNNKNEYTNFIVHCKNNTRLECKKQIVDKILEKLLEII